MRCVLTRIVLLLIIGVVINIAIAWGLAVRPDPRLFETLSNSPMKWTVESGNNRGIISVTGETSISEVRNGPKYFERAAVSNAEFRELLPNWSCLHSRCPVSDRADASSYREFAFGWPMNAMLFQYWFLEPADEEARQLTHGLLEIPYAWVGSDETDQIARISGRRNRLPLIPIWPGFYINTLFYACVAWLVFLAPFAALRFTKRARRRRNGWCLQCGYDLRGATNVTCPECGHAPATADVHPRL